MQRLLEDYLSEVSVRLSGMPASRRKEELREMTAHLQDAISIRMENGATEEEAMQSAVQQFGAPDVIASESMTSWKREKRQLQVSFWGAAFCYFAYSSLFTLLLNSNIMSIIHYPPGPASLAVVNTITTISILLKMCVSALIGAKFPKRAVAGVAMGMAALEIVWLATLALIFLRHPNSFTNFHQLASFYLASLASFWRTCLLILLSALIASRVRMSSSGRAQPARR